MTTMEEPKRMRRVNGVDCPRSAFAWTPSDDADTWRLPVLVLGSPEKTVNAVKSSLHRFDAAQIPAPDRVAVWNFLCGAAAVLGIPFKQRTFDSAGPSPAAVERPPVPDRVEVKRVVVDPEVDEVVALADRRATEMLRALGLE
jgi:hypothetical protein